MQLFLAMNLLGCGSSQLPSEAYSLVCASEVANGDDTAFTAVVNEKVTHEPTKKALLGLLELEVHERPPKLLNGAYDAGLGGCELATSWKKAVSTAAAMDLCQVPERCKAFDSKDLDTLNDCVVGAAETELERMPVARMAMAKAIESFARSNGIDTCPLVIALRQP